MAKEQKKMPVKEMILKGIAGKVIHRNMNLVSELEKKLQENSDKEIHLDAPQKQPLGWVEWIYNGAAGVAGGAAGLVFPNKDSENPVDDIQPAGDVLDPAE